MKKRQHGWSRTPEYRCWTDMKRRCNNPKERAFKWYGARGISVCARWMESFENFLEDMGKRPSAKHSIERIKNEIGYMPGNCCWATRAVQSRNTRRNVLIEGVCLTDAATLAGINPITVRYRRRYGLPLLVPVGIGKKLKAEDIPRIREKYKTSSLRPAENADAIAAEYGITRHTVWNIVARRIWRKVP